MVSDTFAIFILSHGRATNMKTVETLKNVGYTGKTFIIIDNEDKQADLYYETFGRDSVIMFDKIEKAKETDTCDMQKKRNIVIFARNSCHDIAKQLGLTHFLVLDDDYTSFRKRYEKNGVFSSLYVTDLDAIINETLEFLDNSGAVTVAFAQTGDFIGGMGSKVYKERLTRKAMNSFFCRTDRPFEFYGRINEDVNTYVTLGSRGHLFFTIADMSLDQLATQQNKGGLTDTYLDNGTYVKSYYTVMMNPSNTKISEMGVGHKRLHHLVLWDNVTPKIISDRFRKE